MIYVYFLYVIIFVKIISQILGYKCLLIARILGLIIYYLASFNLNPMQLITLQVFDSNNV